jgi:UDP-N-acetylmuramoyl-L-alanyl-D-glutamate--2,6-diaminopimelate ligase
MRLKELLNGIDISAPAEISNPEITGISYDSRAVKPGDLFVAITGFHTDGHKYIPAAISMGAVAVLSQEGQVAPESGPPQITVQDPRLALAGLVNHFYDYPSRKMGIIGVTGTDGKTTTSYLSLQILERAGFSAGLISTVFFQTADSPEPNGLRQTTPESLEIQSMLAQMVSNGKQYAVVESTSHALALHRLTGCEYDVAVMTNVTHEHLDYHGTFENYRDAKASLFGMMDGTVDKGVPKAGVINADDPSAAYFRSKTSKHIIDYGVKNPAAIRASEIDAAADGTRFTMRTPLGDARIALPLPADFNVYNAMAAAGVGISQGIDLSTICSALESAKPVTGRMERIDEGQDFTVIVDYAHTPGAIEKVLRILRPLTRGRLMAVFGSAGERDVAKRSMQGRIAAQLCDFCVFTNEDPRFEDEWKILRDIAGGAVEAGKSEGKDFLLIPDRQEAIGAAVKQARAGDTILLAGKGHESCIIVGDEKQPWDEAQVAHEVLRGLR